MLKNNQNTINYNVLQKMLILAIIILYHNQPYIFVKEILL